MPMYQRLGKVPPKRHSIFRREDGALYREELFGNMGFAGISSLLYHIDQPTAVLDVRHLRDITPQAIDDPSLRNRHLRTARLPKGGSAVLDRVQLFFNDDVLFSLSKPAERDEFFFRNGQADELVYVSHGEGVLETMMGELAYRAGDYLVIPRGIVHRYRLGAEEHCLLHFESRDYVRTPKRYRNEHGQLLEGAPFCERDIRVPDKLVPRDEDGEFRVLVKAQNQLNEYLFPRHPLDVVGWDGYYYPWAFNIGDFEAKVARFHLPPPVHQTFEAAGYVICSFCPRPYDFDPEAIPAPYFHANAMSDELIYYASQEFMSRKGVEYGSVTLHPDGIPHGPQPGKTEESIGKPGTDELAVMLDTFAPLKMCRPALEIEDAEYYRSWIE